MKNSVRTSRTPRVTIGIPTFNRLATTLPDALRSALEQTYSDLEVVVCDNASEDGTEAFMASERDPRLRYHRHPSNIGANANFNACLDLAEGTYFLLLPDDDLLDDTFVARAMAAIGDRSIGAALGGVSVIDGNGAELAEAPAPTGGLGPTGLFEEWFGSRTSLYLLSTLFHTESLRAAGGFASPQHLFQDVVAIARAVARHGYVAVPGSAGAFRRHDTNRGSAGHALRWAEDSTFLLEVLCEELPEDAERLRTKGAPYLAAKCYRYVTRIRSPLERWRLYRSIHERFGRRYAPWAFICRHHWIVGRDRLRAIKRRLLLAHHRRQGLPTVAGDHK